MNRRTLFSIALLTLAGCPRAQAPAPPLVARTDLARLAQLVALPAGAESARWIVRPLGAPSRAPGPTDTELVAYVVYPPERWARLEAELGGARGIESLQLDEGVARAVLPDAVFNAAPAHDGRRRVRGAQYALPEGPSAGNYRGNDALRLGAALLVVRHAE